MILSGKEILNKIKKKDILIDPYDNKSLNPNSYNLKLSDELIVYDEKVLDMRKKNKFRKIKIKKDGLIIYPGKLYLGRTLEYTETNNLVPMLEGRSSVGRLGLFIHVTAGFGDVGFKGFWTLEIHCVQPIKIYSGIEICQIYYHTLRGEYENYKSDKYQNNSGIQISMLYKDFK
ncbi:MAG: dCTP deaminase [Clostridiales bacterium]|jgi:dCTP deaminase|nr:dCTP deaminase [Clostridiales bacterium]